MDPKKRLGFSTDEETSYKALRNHPYFSGIDFERSIDASSVML